PTTPRSSSTVTPPASRSPHTPSSSTCVGSCARHHASTGGVTSRPCATRRPCRASRCTASSTPCCGCATRARTPGTWAPVRATRSSRGRGTSYPRRPPRTSRGCCASGSRSSALWTRPEHRRGTLGVRLADPVGGAQPRDGARTARGAPREARAPAVDHEPVREHRPLTPLDELADRVLDLDRVGLLGPPQTPREATHVRVDRDPRDPEGVAEHDVGRLAPDARERDEVLEAPGDLAVVLVDELAREALDRPRLGAEEARGADDLLDLLGVCARVGLRVGEAREQLGGDQV